MKPTAAAVLGAVTISFSAIFVALADVTPITAAFFRPVYALPLLGILAWRVRRRDDRPRSARLLAIGAGAAIAVDLIAWHQAIADIGAGLATLLANIQVLLVGVAAWIIHSERPSRTAMMMTPVVITGVALVTGLGDPSAFGAHPVRGALLALVAAAFYTVFLLALRASNRTLAPAPSSLFDATLGTAVAVILIGAFSQGLDITPRWPSHGWLLTLGLFVHVGGWLALTYALPRLPALSTSYLLLIQPVGTLIWGALILTERPSVIQALGVVVVLVSVTIVSSRGSVAPQRS